MNGSDQEEKEDSADEDDPSYDTDDVQEEQVDTAEFEEDEDDKVNNSDEEENKDSASEDAALILLKLGKSAPGCSAGSLTVDKVPTRHEAGVCPFEAL